MIFTPNGGAGIIISAPRKENLIYLVPGRERDEEDKSLERKGGAMDGEHLLESQRTISQVVRVRAGKKKKQKTLWLREESLEQKNTERFA